MRRTVKEKNGMYSLKEGVECNVLNLIQELGRAEDKVNRLGKEILNLGSKRNEIRFSAAPGKLFAEEKPSIHIKNLTINIQAPESLD